MVVSITSLPDGSLYEVTFDLGRFEQNGRCMVVAGTFNNWSTRLDRPRYGLKQLGRISPCITITLPRGRYEYKYYDAAHEEWMEVWRHPEIYRGYNWDYTWNVFGTLNCVLQVPWPQRR